MKQLIALAVIGVILIVGIIIGVNFVNQKTVSFTFDTEGYSVEVLNNSETIINTLNTPGEIRVQAGEYTYKVIGEGLDPTAIPFTVTESTTIAVTSHLTAEALNSKLDTELTAIQDVLRSRYSNQSPFTIDRTRLYERGDWASVNLLVDIPQQAPNTYRTVLHKENGTWIIKIPPTIAINKNDYKDVPKSVLSNLYTP